MMRSSVAALLVAAAAVIWLPQASADERPTKAYLLFPVQTQLQREFFFEPQVRYHLLVHGDSLVSGDGKVDPALLDFDDLTDEIGRFRITGGRIRALLIFAKRPPEATIQLVNMAILGWARESGFERHVPTTVGGEGGWKAAVRLTGDARGLYAENESEDAVGDEAVRVYPVRTALSRILSDEADCVISFLQPYGKDATGTIDAKTKARLKEFVDSLKLNERKRVEFGIRLTDDRNRQAVDQFRNTTAHELADELGFKDFSVLQKRVR